MKGGGRLRNKFKFKPLPLVPCIEFKGLGGKAKRNVTLMQIFATLFQVVKYSFANRSVSKQDCKITSLTLNC